MFKYNIKCDVNQYTTTPPPTPYTTSRHTYHKSANIYLHAANSLLKTIDFNLEDIKQWAILESGATSHFLLTDAPREDERQTLNPIAGKLPDGRRVTSRRLASQYSGGTETLLAGDPRQNPHPILAGAVLRSNY